MITVIIPALNEEEQIPAVRSLPTLNNGCPEFIRHEKWLMRSLR